MLKSSGYKWTPNKQKRGGSWSRAMKFTDESFLDHFKESSWTEFADDVRIVILSDNGELEKEIEIVKGKLY